MMMVVTRIVKALITTIVVGMATVGTAATEETLEIPRVVVGALAMGVAVVVAVVVVVVVLVE